MRIYYTRLFLLNYIYLVILECIFKFFVIKTIDIGLLYLLIFSLPIALGITFLMSLFSKTRINQVISIILWFFMLMIMGAETVYYSFYKTICGFSALMYSDQVMDFYGAIFSHILFNKWNIIAMFVPFIVLVVLSVKHKISHEKFRKKDTLVLFFVTIFFALSSLEYKAKEEYSAKKLFFSTNDLMQSTNTFGIFSSLTLDTIKLGTKFEEAFELFETRSFTKEKGTEYNITDIPFDNLIKNEKDATLKKMHTYFSTAEATNKNEYTGIFAGKNLVYVVAEGFYPIAVDKELTPTLYELVNNSFVFQNFYQPIYNCSTSDGEFINDLSILPGVATCSMKATIGKYLPYSLGNIMDDYGYTTKAFHGWTYTYYNRDKTMPNLGYTYYGYDRYHKKYKYALKGIKDSWPTSDIDVMNASYPIYSKDENFLAYYMSISGHLEYNFSGGNAISSKNKKAVSSIKANNTIKAYIASQIEFDRSMKILIDNLKRDGILEDTVIVVTPDHYPYGLSNADIASYVDWMKNPNFDLYKNNLIIYNSEMEKKEIDSYVSSLDLLPTLLNLFGIQYDSRLLIGHDIFSTAEDLIIFNNKSWITSKGRYDYLKKKFEPFTEEEVSQSYINEINQKVKLKFQMSKLLISKDYYRKIFRGEK